MLVFYHQILFSWLYQEALKQYKELDLASIYTSLRHLKTKLTVGTESAPYTVLHNVRKSVYTFPSVLSSLDTTVPKRPSNSPAIDTQFDSFLCWYVGKLDMRAILIYSLKASPFSSTHRNITRDHQETPRPPHRIQWSTSRHKEKETATQAYIRLYRLKWNQLKWYHIEHVSKYKGKVKFRGASGVKVNESKLLRCL